MLEMKWVAFLAGRFREELLKCNMCTYKCTFRDLSSVFYEALDTLYDNRSDEEEGGRIGERQMTKLSSKLSLVLKRNLFIH